MTTSPSPNRSRREFLCESSAAAAAVSSVGVVARMSSAEEHAGGSAANLRKEKSIETRAKQARRLAVDSHGTIFVAADRGITAFAENGCKLGYWETERSPRCLAVVDDATLVVGTRRNLHAFQIMRGESLELTRLKTLASLPEDSLLSSLASDGKHLYAADAGAKTIWKLTLAGEVVSHIDAAGGTFRAPVDFFSIAIGTDAAIHAAHAGRHRIERYNADGELTGKWGTSDRTEAGFAGCCNPIALTRLPTGHYVTAERGQPRIKLFAADGTFVKQLATPDDYPANQKAAENDNGLGCNRGGFDLASDRQGRLYVLDRTTGVIDRYQS